VLDINARCVLASSQGCQLLSYMADSLKRRLSELERLGHLPEDAGVRFAVVNAGATARVDRLMVRLQALEAKTQSALASMSTQIDELEGKLAELRRARDQLLKRLPLAL
jgi:hypothetical protein